MPAISRGIDQFNFMIVVLCHDYIAPLRVLSTACCNHYMPLMMPPIVTLL